MPVVMLALVGIATRNQLDHSQMMDKRLGCDVSGTALQGMASVAARHHLPNVDQVLEVGTASQEAKPAADFRL
jgi:hypothetical protein